VLKAAFRVASEQSGPQQNQLRRGDNGGCGFVFPSHLPVMQAGHLTNTPYSYSVVVYGMLFISFYGTWCPRDTFTMLHDTLCTATASGRPFVFWGGFQHP
jgi:hypothetical protein